jgi:hypothetical protein
LPDGSIEVRKFKNREFKDLFYHDGTFYTKQEKDRKGVTKPYKKLNTVYDKNGRNDHVNVIDANGVFRAIMLDMFKLHISKQNL